MLVMMPSLTAVKLFQRLRARPQAAMLAIDFSAGGGDVKKLLEGLRSSPGSHGGRNVPFPSRY
jgi:hypothetical protein